MNNNFGGNNGRNPLEDDINSAINHVVGKVAQGINIAANEVGKVASEINRELGGNKGYRPPPVNPPPVNPPKKNRDYTPPHQGNNYGNTNTQHTQYTQQSQYNNQNNTKYSSGKTQNQNNPNGEYHYSYSYKYEPKVKPVPAPKMPVDKSIKRKRRLVRWGVASSVTIAYTLISIFLGSPVILPVLLAMVVSGLILGSILGKAFVRTGKKKVQNIPEPKITEPKAEAPKKAEEVKKKSNTGNPELDKIIDDGDEYIKKLRIANIAIEDEGVSNSIDRMELASLGIFDYVKDHPAQIPQIKKFMNYYLPTTLKLLNSYEKLSKQAVKGENISSTMFDIEGMMQTIATAFEKQLDGLFSSEAMDIQADITVFESILKQEGLKDDETKVK